MECNWRQAMGDRWTRALPSQRISLLSGAESQHSPAVMREGFDKVHDQLCEGLLFRRLGSYLVHTIRLLEFVHENAKRVGSKLLES